MSRPLARYGDFAPLPHGNGGNRRASQVIEALADAGLEFTTIEKPAKPASQVARAGWKLRGLARAATLGAPRGATLRGGGLLAESCATLAPHAPGVLVWEPSPRTLMLGRAAQSMGWKVIALPHNLESLVPGERSPWSRRPSPQWLAEEAHWLGGSDAAFCIAREEQWLLRTLGIDAGYLPYFPPRAEAARLAALRARRADAAPGRRILILGSVANTPTRLGMREQLALLAGAPAELRAQIVVAGFEAERLLDDFAGAGFRIEGSVSQERLDQLMLEARCLHVHQVPTSGALTRIVDFLCAGVPVVANLNAARNCQRLAGVHVYDRAGDALALLQQALPVPPPPPRADTSALIEAISRLR